MPTHHKHIVRKWRIVAQNNDNSLKLPYTISCM